MSQKANQISHNSFRGDKLDSFLRPRWWNVAVDLRGEASQILADLQRVCVGRIIITRHVRAHLLQEWEGGGEEDGAEGGCEKRMLLMLTFSHSWW